MPSYTLEIEAFGIYTTNMPSLEIWEDGVLDSTHSIFSNGSTISLSISYGGTVPTSLNFVFNDGYAAAGRSIEIRSVKINDMYVNVDNYLSANLLAKGDTATVDIASSSFFYDSTEPALSEFTVGATRTLTVDNDTIRIFSGTDPEIFDAKAGRDVIFLGAGNDKVFGNSGNDIIRGGVGDDLLSGGDGNDRVYGEEGDDRLYGGAGDDSVYGDEGNDEIFGGAGNDNLVGHDGDDLLVGEAGNDKINGGAGIDFIFGGDDDDQLVGADGNDTLDGGNGNDLAYGGSGDDTINGGDGDDFLIGDLGNDTISGDSGDDTLLGSDGDDFLYGAADNDLLIGGDGTDTLEGGAGDDILIGNVGQYITVDASTLLSYAGSQDGTTTISYFTGGVTLDGNPWKKIALDYKITANTVIEFDFKSTLEGEIHAIGFDNNDNIDDDTNKFKVYGSQTWNRDIDAFDNYDGSGDWNHYTINVGTYFTGTFSHITLIGDDDANPRGNGSWANIIMYESTGPAELDTLMGGDGIDQLYGQAGNDVLNGGAGNDILNGGTGNDVLNGDADNDILHGGDGNDTLNGGDDNDELYGDAGNDTLNGDAGDDILNGGTGTNILNAGGGNDTVNGGSGNDTIYGDGDADVNAGIDAILAANPGVIYSAATNSFYQLVTTNATYAVARANAMSITIDGVVGHLVNISSATENSIVNSLVVAESWIGATDQASEGVWIWQDGAESGVQFWAGAAAGSTVGGNYANWNGGEPNNSGGNEDGASMRTDGLWNDLNVTSSIDYVIEWEAANFVGTNAGDDILNGGAGDDTIYGDYYSATIGSTTGWYYQYYDLPGAPGSLAGAGFTLNGGKDNTNTPTDNGITQIINPSNYDTGDNFALKFTTTLTITTAGTYTFQTSSDDGSELYLDGVRIVNNGGLHGTATVTSAGQALSAGTYTLEAVYFEQGGGQVMDVLMAGPDTGGGYVSMGAYADVAVQNAGAVTDGNDIINGGAGADTLYGGGGIDTFLFEAVSAFADTDTIMDFSILDGDILDISDLIVGAFSGTITDYVQFTESGGDTLVQVDANGLTGGSSYQTIANFDGLTGLDVSTLYANGEILV